MLYAHLASQWKW